MNYKFNFNQKFNYLLYLVFAIFLNSISAQNISSGQLHSSAICIDGSLKAWGINTNGQLGNDTNISSLIPTNVLINDVVQTVSCTWFDGLSFALKKDGTVWAWGHDAGSGYLGDSSGTSLDYRDVPNMLPNLSNVKSIDAAGSPVSSVFLGMALKTDGTVWVWGFGNSGAMGNGGTMRNEVPAPVPGLSNIKQISSGRSGFAVALRQDGTVWTWGSNYYGAIGDSTYTNRFTPFRVANLNNIVDISAGTTHVLALKADGTVWAWGNNGCGALGDGTYNSHLIPTQVIGINNVKKISAGELTSFAIKNDNTLWAWGANNHGQLGIGTYINQLSPVLVNIDNIAEVAPGYLHCMALSNDGIVWSWGYNTNGQLGDSTTITRPNPGIVGNLCYVPSPQIEYSHNISGNIYHDFSNDCINQASEFNLGSVPVVANPGTIYGLTDDSGKYVIGLNDSLNYTLTPLVLPEFSHMLNNSCPSNYNIYLTSLDPIDTANFDFGFIGNPCFQLKVDVASNRKRRCMKSQTVLHYLNEGLAPAYNVTIHIKFDQFDIPLSATKPYIFNSADSSMVFEIDTLRPRESGTITIVDSIMCLNGIDGMTQCTKAWILPVNQCLIDSTTGVNWDHSSLNVTGRCISDTTLFKIKNFGQSMVSTSQFRIYADNILTQSGNFLLNANDSLMIYVISLGATIRLEADQSQGHPGTSLPRATIEGCGRNTSGTFSIGYINQAPMDDADIDVEIDCIAITGSYDPNDKQNSPVGMDLDHIISPQTQIDYVVQFQNTGNDTAFTVLIIDTLSNDFDLSTLQIGASSHPYSFSLSGQGKPILKFKFENILLPDSTTDELNSHGFIKYKISPLSSLPLGTRISNYADIFFDYNFPVRTNESFVTLGNINTFSVDEFVKKSGNIISYPNPFSNSLTLLSNNGSSILSIDIFSMDGKLLQSKFFISKASKINIELNEIAAGCYFINCKTTNGNEMVRVIKY